MAMMIEVEVFCVVTPCSVVVYVITQKTSTWIYNDDNDLYLQLQRVKSSDSTRIRRIFFTIPDGYESHDSSVCIALGYGLDYQGSRVRFPAGAGNFSLHHRVQNGAEAHPASYPIRTRGSFPGGKAAEAWSWRLTSI
jgi:hypothetical protein